MTKQAFEGLKVLDFSWIVAGPWVAKYLGDHGATIVHIESLSRPDMKRVAPPYRDGIPGVNRSSYFINYHQNQFSMALNMKYPKALEIAKKLLAWADVVNENFIPGAMARFGLSYEEMKKIKPDIILLSQSTFGETGPAATVPGTGIQLTALSGISSVTGWQDREPAVLYGGFTDTGAARIALVALVAALDYRKRTGKGQHIDLSQYEAGGVQFVGPLVMDYVANGRIASRAGNTSPYAAPHGVYPCLTEDGRDRWCAIAVFSDEEWHQLVRAMGEPAWAAYPGFATLAGRKSNEAELNGKLAEWTSQFTSREVMERLQKAGISAGMVNDFKDMYEDPQLNHRQYWWKVDHPEVGIGRYEAEAFNLSRTPRQSRMSAPLIGQHTIYVCNEILGMSDAEYLELLNEGVFE